ncbi:hypothetical protein WMR10_004510 [Stenotrophomonas maltophilia]|uniref:hypothetical protein n=1 Tax=Stenotrophomonas sp. SMYL89 TaxID=3076046 RepID=UPI002E784B24|nr:hypothetical protein [Stenotrophomonas sp. SMYL89]HDS1662653.1 hypothetical protein [Stenotrophomonas maltophilia]
MDTTDREDNRKSFHSSHDDPLIAQTLHYRNTGILPECAKCELPTLVWTQTAGDRKKYQPVRQGVGA